MGNFEKGCLPSNSDMGPGILIPFPVKPEKNCQLYGTSYLFVKKTLGGLLVTAGEARAIILGDIFHCALQIEHPEWTNIFDRDPEQAKATRRRMLHELAQPSTTGGATHVAASVFISLG